jgi:hypothetical protein
MECMDEYIGKTVLVGITFHDEADRVVERAEKYGHIISIDDADGIKIRNPDTHEEFCLPPAPEALEKAEPGKYTLQSTGTTVMDPDYIAVLALEIDRHYEGDVPEQGA